LVNQKRSRNPCAPPGAPAAPETFLVFGNDRQVPILWLERYGNLVSGVTFYFLSDDGELEELPNPAAVGGGKPREPEGTSDAD
jgi:hypothetical protein